MARNVEWIALTHEKFENLHFFIDLCEGFFMIWSVFQAPFLLFCNEEILQSWTSLFS